MRNRQLIQAPDVGPLDWQQQPTLLFNNPPMDVRQGALVRGQGLQLVLEQRLMKVMGTSLNAKPKFRWLEPARQHPSDSTSNSMDLQLRSDSLGAEPQEVA